MPTRLRHPVAFIGRDGSRLHRTEGKTMRRVTVFAGVFFAIVAAPPAAHAQGVPGGAAHGFHEGNRIAGPVGAVIGTAVGGVIGGVEGVLSIHHPAAYTAYEEAPPPAYRPHRAYRGKKHAHR